MPQYIGLIGCPVKHSISPHFQQAALDYYSLDIRYEARETGASRLQEAVNDLRGPRYIGANVTVPYKETILPLLDGVDYLAGAVGAVNTVVKQGDRLLGLNSDVHGFTEALAREGQFDPQGKRAVMIGAGGVARAAGFALIGSRVSSLAIVNRTQERARALADTLERHIADSGHRVAGPQAEVTTLPWQSLSSVEALETCDLIVHCTTMGMKHGPEEGESPLSLEVIPRSVLVYDLVYNPWPTPLLRLAREAGADILGGLPMLVYQGAMSFEMWTGKPAPVDVMFSKAREILTGS
ncbi:MAG: shikimate dehydrogenase [Dehalococcoidia bacterium]